LKKFNFFFNSKLNCRKLRFNTPLSLTCSTKKKDKSPDKLTINWQNFSRVRLQLKFACIILILYQLTIGSSSKSSCKYLKL